MEFEAALKASSLTAVESFESIDTAIAVRNTELLFHDAYE